MSLKTCLLITDDPDDHHAFTEAIGKIYPSAVVLIVIDPAKALKLLMESYSLTDYLIIDLDTNGLEIKPFLDHIKNVMAVQHLPKCFYGEQETINRLSDEKGVTFFSKDYEYSDLQAALSSFIR
jgi:hypothetical protein